MAVCRQTWCWRSQNSISRSKGREGDCIPHWAELEHRRPQSPASTVTYFLQQSHTYSHKVTRPNSATPYEPSIQTHESMGAILIQTTTHTYTYAYIKISFRKITGRPSCSCPDRLGSGSQGHGARCPALRRQCCPGWCFLLPPQRVRDVEPRLA